MILQGARIRATQAAAAAVAQHVLEGPANEKITVLQGGRDSLLLAAQEAQQEGKPYGIRHWKLAPGQATTREQLDGMLGDLAAEFSFDRSSVTVIEHRKPRASGDPGNGVHWHILVPEWDGLRVLDCRNDRRRHERLSRTWEARLGHQLTVGAHGPSVARALEARGEDALAEKIRQTTSPPRSAFTGTQHQVTARRGISLPDARLAVARAWSSADGRPAIDAALAEHGLRLRRGDRAWIIESEDGVLVGSLARLVRRKPAEIQAFLENGHEHTSRPALGRPGPEQVVELPRSGSAAAGSDRAQSTRRSHPARGRRGIETGSAPAVIGSPGTRRSEPSEHPDRDRRRDGGGRGQDRAAPGRTRGEDVRDARQIAAAARPHVPRLERARQALASLRAASQPQVGILLEDARQRLRATFQEHRRHHWASSAAAVQRIVEARARGLRWIRATKLDWDLHRAWANRLRAAHRSRYQATAWADYLAAVARDVRNTDQRAAALLLALEPLQAEAKALRDALDRMRDPPFPIEDLLPAALGVAVRQRQERAVTAARHLVAQAQDDLARESSPFGLFTWLPGARAAAVRLRLVQDELAQRELDLSRGPNDVALRLERERRQAANDRWAAERSALLSKADIFTVIRLVRAGDPRMQGALLRGGLEEGIRLLEEAEEARIRPVSDRQVIQPRPHVPCMDIKQIPDSYRISVGYSPRAR